MRGWSAALIVMLFGCDAGGASLEVEVASDLVPGVEVTALRVEVADEASFDGRVDTRLTALDTGASLAEGVPGGEWLLGAAGRRWIRVGLLDAHGRLRAERTAAVDARGHRRLTIALERSCAARLCPGEGDADDAFACHGGACVPEACIGEDPAACPGARLCVTDGDCASASPCRDAVCRAGACLEVDACGDGRVCDGATCRTAPVCGDGACDVSAETACRCPADCGECPTGCGDGVCGPREEEACPEDCGPPPATCGDGVCDVESESDVSCPEDCDAAAVGPTCGDARCEGGERCAACPECCDARGCGDGVCDAAETACGCPADCGPCTWCGDGRCEPGEACEDDCDGDAPVCGDGTCQEGESCALCEADCGWCVGVPSVQPDDGCVGAVDAPSETCGGLHGAYTNEAVNVGYFPMRVIAPEGDDTPLVSGDLEDGARGVILRMLPSGARFAAQSVRNPGCSEAPPLRPARDGWVFGYVVDDGAGAAYGWVRADDLELDDDGDRACVYGVDGGAFALRLDPYASDACRPLHCEADDFFRGCRDANPIGEGSDDCGRARDEARSVLDTAPLHFAPVGPARTYVHAGDRVRVLHESGRAGWVFVELLESGAPRTAPNGSRGWMRASGLRLGER